MARLHRMAAAGAAALALALPGISQVASPDQGPILAGGMSDDHGQSRGDQDRSSDSEKDQNKDSYDSGEYQGDDESRSKKDETLVDVDALNTPDE